MRYSDANHVVSANEQLVGYLQEFGISTERRSIYKDIGVNVIVEIKKILRSIPTAIR
jgi:hypothetical protein